MHFLSEKFTFWSIFRWIFNFYAVAMQDLLLKNKIGTQEDGKLYIIIFDWINEHSYRYQLSKKNDIP